MLRGFAFLFLFSITLSAPAMADGELPDGAKAVVQRNGDGEITSIRLYDLWGSDFSKRALGDPTAYAQKIAALLAKVNPPKYASLPEALTATINNFKRLPDGELPAAKIAGEYEEVSKDGRFTVVLVSKSVDGSYSYNGEIWDQMDETNRAGTYFHLALLSLANKPADQDIRGVVWSAMQDQSEPDLAGSILAQGTRNHYRLSAIVLTDYAKYDTYKEEEEARKKATDSFPKACEDWKAATTAKLQKFAELFYLDCGKPEAQKLGSHGAKYYVGVATGQVHLTLPQGAIVVKESLAGSITSATVNGAVITAYNSYVDARNAWIASVEKKWGKDLLMTSCAPFSQSSIQEGERTGLSSVSGYLVQGSCQALVDIQDKQYSLFSPSIKDGYYSREIKAGDLNLYRSTRVYRQYRDTELDHSTKALAAVGTDCANWKETMSRNLGSRLIHASCGSGLNNFKGIDAMAWVLE